MSVDEELHRHAFAALQARRAAADEGSGTRPVPASRIVAYARRGDAMADLALERALRAEPGLQRLYRRALAGVAQASSIRAAAASGTQVTHRRIGAHRLEIVTEADDMPWLVLRLAEGAAPVTMIELLAPDGTARRLALGAPIDGVIQLPLDPAFPELAGIAGLIGDPGSEIHLL